MSQANEGKSLMLQGRLVWLSGDLFKGKPRVDDRTKQPVINPKTGQQVIEYGFGLAVPKTAIGEMWTVMHEQAYSLYPSRQLPPGFSWKYKDGDTDIDPKGVPYSQREGYPGHLVFACTTTIPIKFFKWENNQNTLINEGIKCGDYVNVQLNVRAHGPVGQGKPGLYLNPNAVQFLGFGKEIVNLPSGDTIFGNQAPTMPPGASATPIAPPGMLVPPSIPQFGQAPPPQSTVGYVQPQSTVGYVQPQSTVGYVQPQPMQMQQPIQPNYGVLPQQHQPQMQQPGLPPIPGIPQ